MRTLERVLALALDAEADDEGGGDKMRIAWLDAVSTRVRWISPTVTSPAERLLGKFVANDARRTEYRRSHICRISSTGFVVEVETRRT